MNGITGKAPALSPEQVAEIRRRYRLRQENTLVRIAADMGISTSQASHAVRIDYKHHIALERRRA